LKKGKYKNKKLGLHDKGSERKILKPNAVIKKESKKNEGT